MRFPSKLERMLDAGAIVEWRPVRNYEGLYEVNNVGDVRRLKGKGCRQTRILKPGKDQNGYFLVSLWKSGEGKTHKVHRLVMHAFVGQCPAGMEVNHRDEKPQNNNINNLEYVTQRQNCNYGTHNERSARTRSVPIECFDLISGKVIRRYQSTRDAGRDGHNRSCIYKCIKGFHTQHHGVGWRLVEK